MSIKICPICSKEFEIHNGRHICCSRKCYNQQYRQANKTKLKQYSLLYHKNNKHNKRNKKSKEVRKQWRNRKVKESINFKLRCCLSTRLNAAIKRNSKSSSTLKLLGCSISELKIYLENQFKQGMTWDNHGQWHIDHIIPCCSFDLSLDEEQKKCFHYTNLQPLWAEENMRKSGKIN